MNINKAQVEMLKDYYADVCDRYLEAFCFKYELPYEKDAWVANQHGTTANVGDYFFDFHDVIKFCVDNDIKNFDEVLRWYDYTLDCHYLGIENTPTFPQWHKGCPRLERAQLYTLKKQKEDLDKIIEECNGKLY